ncbi:type I-C CRISPR-associated protein Cas5 [Mariprofundus erugo]|uniref:pre-crRNA processing endonuclease n=1 Tax=Mariprofundus erugo TaxID=2528639 RepID=A0A5R9GT59_9PROT|nr:type I-C CRISPR-associated protein Cas5c [Mariprofundus erugo]TLS67623.1 type I-C CRISPR-associated protein Cas5 [Mariprofundus erugo]
MKNFCLEVWGDFACFTRPEMKVERVSYDVITPSSARAIFEAILWKPAIRWHVRRIEVLAPIKWINVRRNEVGAVISERNVKTAMNQGKGNLGLNIEEERQQRASLFLRDVKYRIHAAFEMTDKAGDGDTSVKFSEMFERRASKGQCFNQPYLGCREFSANFKLVNPKEETAPSISECRDLGWMLYDLDYGDPKDPKPLFFRAELKNGVIEVPAFDSEEVRG